MVIGTGEALDGWKEGCRSFKEEGWQDGMATHGLLFPVITEYTGKVHPDKYKGNHRKGNPQSGGMVLGICDLNP